MDGEGIKKGRVAADILANSRRRAKNSFSLGKFGTCLLLLSGGALKRAPRISHWPNPLGAQTYNPGSCWAFYGSYRLLSTGEPPEPSLPSKLPVSASASMRPFFKSFISGERAAAHRDTIHGSPDCI